jgi:hypothetical protein
MDSMVVGRKISTSCLFKSLQSRLWMARCPVHIGGTFHIDEAIEANRIMEQNTVDGKIVVLT